MEVGRTRGRAANPLGFAPPPLLLPPLCATLFTPALPKTPAHGFSPPHCPCRYNERELRWVALDTWTFSLQFDAPRSLLSHAAVLLRCDGLDTVASIELNGSPVGAAVNAHRPHSYDVTQLLAEGPNRLAIRFESAAGYAAAQRDAYPYPVPHTQQVGAVPGYNFIRKAARQASFQLEWVLLFFLVPACKARVQAQCFHTLVRLSAIGFCSTFLTGCSPPLRSDFGWDWGPAFPAAGITGGVELVGYSTAMITGEQEFDLA